MQTLQVKRAGKETLEQYNAPSLKVQCHRPWLKSAAIAASHLQRGLHLGNALLCAAQAVQRPAAG